jgi:hypothetical protein
MKPSRLVVSFAVLVGLAAIIACGKPSINAERTAACKDAGNHRMCGICCKTKVATFTPGQNANEGMCECFGAEEK